MTEEPYYHDLLAAYVRGSLPGTAVPDALEDLAALARAAGLTPHRFKRTHRLPRVARVLGALRGLMPASLLDLGSGRGVFLWPLLDTFPHLRVVAIDVLPARLGTIQCVHRGGVTRLSAARADMTRLPFRSGAVEIVTALEVFEHLQDPAAAAREALRTAARAVLVSVPSRPDDNPQHVRLFDRASLEALLTKAGARRVQIDHVLNHMVAVALH